MALINRFSRLFRADLHAVLDRIEEPEVLLRQSVREMEQSLAEEQRNLKLMEHELQSIPALLTEVNDQLAQIQEEIKLCIDNDNDKLARSKIRRKLELQQRAKRLQSKQESLNKEEAALREQVNTNQHRLESMRQKLEIFSQETNRYSQTQTSMTDAVITEDDVEVALLREKQLHSKKSGGGK